MNTGVGTEGRSLELFFIDGRPDGMLTAQVFNWTGHVLRIPRTQLKEGLLRSNAAYTGVYLLLGTAESGPLAYIGEAEDMATRIKQHATGKDWWDTAILITTTADNLHKAHVRYLEARLIALARSAADTPLENGNQPSGASLSEADQANMESFLATLMMVLPAIRVDIFSSRKRQHVPPAEAAPAAGIRFECTVPRHNVHAFARLIDGELIVENGSRVRRGWVGDRNYDSQYWKLHDQLVEDGTIVDGILTGDIAFSSPSAAAAVVSGRSTNGRTAWKVVGTGQTYAAWEADQLEKGTG